VKYPIRRKTVEEEAPTRAICYVVCSCGEKHLLKPGIDAPVYWCGDTLKKLQEGDKIEYEESGTK